MDKQTESLVRQEFENAWINDNSGTPGEAAIRRHALNKSWVDEGQFYFDPLVMWAWKWWQKSWESLVVELPQAHDPADMFVSHVYDSADVDKALRSIGIRIKGEGV